MSAPSMVSRDGENTIVKSVDAVFGASEDEDDENESFHDEDGTGSGEDPADLPQCKIKRNYSCTQCDYYTQNPRFYLYHQKQVHKEKIKIFECPHCLYASKHSQKLQRHIHMVHITGKKKIARANMFKNAGVKPQPPPPPSPPPSPPMPEEEEEEMGEEEEELNEENMGEEDFEPRESEPMFGVDGEQVFKCSVCDMLSKSEALIAKHERVVHLKKKFFRCNKCNYMTHMKARYTKHVKYHSMPMIKCDMCDFKTPYKWNLDRHNKNHMGDGAFKCVMCNFAADIKQSLTVHEMNHHVPPVGHMAGNRRRLRVGASDTMGMLTEEDGIDDEELDLLRLEREGSLEQMEQNPADFLQTQLEEPPSPPPPPSSDHQPYTNGQSAPMKLSMRPKLVSIEHPVPYKPKPPNKVIQLQKYKCKFCDFSGNLGVVQRHEVHSHSQEIFGNKPAPAANVGKRPIPNLIPIQGQSILKPPSERKLDSEDRISNQSSKSSSPTHSNDPQENFKRKNASFFDKLKEKLMTNSTERDLSCNICGVESKCLSEHLKHQKTHEDEGTMSSVQGSELSSTRCQHCRQRCKTSTDLMLHLQTCSALNGSAESNHLREPMDTTEGTPQGSNEDRAAHPMENKVFVWNNFEAQQEHKSPPQPSSALEMHFYQPRPEDKEPNVPISQQYPNLNGVSPYDQANLIPQKEGGGTRKVFKCPNCTFWASTASRFHVHIVGHLNKRPFQCSLCHYSSNWRWDITKHIRLKQMRDPTHEKARVLLTDEAGRRNYTKYNKYLVPISLEEFRAAQVPRKSGSVPKENSDPRRTGEFEEDDRPKKKPFSENKKTMWKCKKCLYRNSDRAVVLAHVKEHYRLMADGKMATNPRMQPQPPPSSSELEINEQHITPREENKENDRSADHTENEHEANEHEESHNASEDEESLDCPDFMCETCPFSCDSLVKLEEHAERHFVSQKSIIKCQFCPFYALNSQQLLQHLDLHISDQNPDSSDPKRNVIFACLKCPYVASSHRQLVYHRKWHNKDYDHKCFKCDYSTHTNITLSLHVRLHGRHSSNSANSEPPADPSLPAQKKEPEPILDADISGVDTKNFKDIPMVWVSKPFGISKMFKCRFCPLVNMRKNNIAEHEKMHAFPKESDPNQQRCSHCNYICNNAGVLSSHMKVHQAYFGQVCGIVDNKKPDVEQIEEMKKKIADYETSVKSRAAASDSEEVPPDESQFNFSFPNDNDPVDGLALHFCPVCPGRFLFSKEIIIHKRFHFLDLPFKCESCSYTARTRSHLLAHMKVHTDDYQERTNALSKMYPTDPNFPKPKIVVVLGEPKEANWNWKNESVWVVDREGVDRKMTNLTNRENNYSFLNIENGKKKPLACDKCPAEFFKTLALSYHLSLHGGPGPHKCKYCDYAVKTYGNLLRHEAVHKNAATAKGSREAHVSGLEPSRQRTETERSSPQGGKSASSSPAREDPEALGNPSFCYPTYIKNGKIRQKRFKCHKCPSAFERREAYTIHLSLHGSRQRYSCDKCDYSVKYLANFSQHMKKHKHSEALKKQKSMDSVIDDKDEEFPEDEPGPERSAKSMKMMSMAEQQMNVIMDARGAAVNPPESNISRCPYCPYANSRKDGVSVHLKCHGNAKGTYTCKYCDYSVPQPHFLREHTKLHFSGIRYMKPDAYMKCEKLEIWMEPVDSNHNSEKTLLFKDNGDEAKEERFLPKAPDFDFDQIKGRIYINLKTGEEEIETDGEEEASNEKSPIKAEIKKSPEYEEDDPVDVKTNKESQDKGLPMDESSSDSASSHNSDGSVESKQSSRTHD